jgi:Uma2 family endonuclease
MIVERVVASERHEGVCSGEIAMSIATRPLAYEDLLDTPDDGNRYEIIGGELVVSPVPTPTHQRVLARLFRLIDRFIQDKNLGELFFAPLDVRFDPYDIVEPDLLFIRRERLGIIKEKLIEGAPDLVIEVLSPSSRGHDNVRKMALYATAGVQEYWIADRENEDLAIYSLAAGQYQRQEPSGGSVRSHVLPGLVVDTSSVFGRA